MLDKKLITYIIMVNLVWKIFASVHILCCISRLYAKSSINLFDIRIIKSININCHPKRML